MKTIKLLEIQCLKDLFKLIFDGENIEITHYSYDPGANWVPDKRRFISFIHFIDDYEFFYEGFMDNETKLFTSLTISRIELIKGGSQ